MEAVKGHVNWRCGGYVLWALPEPFKPRDQLVIEDCHFAVEYERGRWQRADRSGELREPPAVVLAGSADEAHRGAVLVRGHAPAVVFFFVDPTVAMERACDFIGLH